MSDSSANITIRRTRVRVRYAETDRMGVVDHANYLVWFEVGRTEWLRATGWSYREMEQEGIALPVIEVRCEYLQPARYDDEIEIRTRASVVTPIRIRFDYDLVRTADDTVAAAGHTVHAALDANGRPCRLPPRVREMLGMKALVTGAAGFIGSHLAEHLISEGTTVVGIDSFSDYYPRERKEENLTRLRRAPGFTLVEASLADADLPRLLDGVSQVFHLAAQAGVRKSWGQDFHVYTSNNLDATQVLLEACVDHPLDRFVYASSSSVYGDAVPLPMTEDAVPHPVSPYGVTKLAAEHLCQLYQSNHGVPAVSVRYFTVYGPRQRPDMGFHRFFRATMRGEALAQYGDGRQTRDFTFVADAVSATVAAAARGKPGAVYNIGGGSRVSLLDVFELIRCITGRPLSIERLDAQPGDMRDTFAETSRARADLGFAPTVTLEQGLRAQFEWMCEAVLF